MTDVEPVQSVHAVSQTLPTGVDRVSLPDLQNQTAPAETINGVDDVRVNADIAILDTGVDASHPDLDVVRSG